MGCDTCVFYPPSACDGKPCCVCDTDDALFTAINQLVKMGVMKRESVACQRKGRILCNRCFCRNARKSKGFGVVY